MGVTSFFFEKNAMVMKDAESYLISNYGSCIALYRGQGNLTLKTGENLSCDFEAGQLADGSTFLLCDFHPPIPHRFDLPAMRFVGRTSEGANASAGGAFHETNYLPDLPADRSPGLWAAYHLRQMTVDYVANAQPRTVRLGLTNFRFVPLTLECTAETAQVSIEPRDGYGDIIKRLQTLKGVDVTCEAVAKIPSDGKISEVEDIVDNLCYILSVARGSKVQWIYSNIYDQKGNLIQTTHGSRITKAYCPLAIIDPRSLEDTTRFIDTSYAVYVDRRDKYKLNQGLIDAYLDAKAESDYLQMRGVKIAVAIEMLKSVFLDLPGTGLDKHILDPTIFSRAHPEIKREIKKTLEPVTASAQRANLYKNLTALNRRSFGELLREITKQLGLGADDQDIELFVRCRNKLIHEGRFHCEVASQTERKTCKPLSNATEEFFFLVSFLDRVFLRLLGYRGPHVDWSSPGKPTRKGEI